LKKILSKRNDRNSQNKKVDNDEDRLTREKVRVRFLISRLFIYPFCFLAVYFLSDAFIPMKGIRLVLSLGLSIFPFVSIIGLLYTKRLSLLRAQSKVLLQSLCTSVSAGYSLESSFLLARPTLEKAFGKRSLMGTALKRLEKSLSAHESLQEAAVDLCNRLDYIELLPVMHALSITRVVGTGVISILRNSCQMMSELIAVKSEVDANNAGKNSEAFLLCLMPFGITFALSSFTGDYLSAAVREPLGVALMLLAFCIAVISCGFLLSLVGEKKKNRGISLYQEDLPFPSGLTRFSKKVTEPICRFLPQGYITGVYGLLSELSRTPDVHFRIFVIKSLTAVLILMPIVLFILMLLSYPMLVAIPLLIIPVFLVHQDLRTRVFRRREEIMEEIPLFLSMLVTLMQSGVLLPKAIETCSSAFPETGVMGSELRIMRAQMLSGMSAGQAIEQFSERTPIPEAQSALLLASRYEVTGGSEVLGLLSLQATSCWSLCRNASRKKREREALAMILPMMLDFISVLLVATTPALISLKLS